MSACSFAKLGLDLRATSLQIASTFAMYCGRVMSLLFDDDFESSSPHAPSASAPAARSATVSDVKRLEAITRDDTRSAPRPSRSSQQPDDVVEAMALAELGERQPRGVAVVGQRLQRAEAQAQALQARGGPVGRAR